MLAYAEPTHTSCTLPVVLATHYTFVCCRRYMQLWQAGLCGMILKLDHSFKVVNRVRDASAHKQFAAVLTVMNEFCQVRSDLSCQQL
jgi:hypothetical protein